MSGEADVYEVGFVGEEDGVFAASAEPCGANFEVSGLRGVP